MNKNLITAFNRHRAITAKNLSKPNPCGTEDFVKFRQVFGLHRLKLHRQLLDGTVLHRFKLHRHLLDGTVKSV